jgi:hypothetical protein
MASQHDAIIRYLFIHCGCRLCGLTIDGYVLSSEAQGRILHGSVSGFQGSDIINGHVVPAGLSPCTAGVPQKNPTMEGWSNAPQLLPFPLGRALQRRVR